jgi:O-antigen/teichoic acid export membrane protein
MEKHYLSTSLFVLTIFVSTILFQFHPIWMNVFFQYISVSPKIIGYFVLLCGIVGLIPFGMSFKIQEQQKPEVEPDPDYGDEEFTMFLKFNIRLLLKVIITSGSLTFLTFLFLKEHFWCKEGTSTLLTLILLFGNGISSIIVGYRTFLLFEFKNNKAKGIAVLYGEFKRNPNRKRNKEYGYGNT